MKLTHIQIDGFGTLSGLSLSGLSPSMNVIHGANGSGKSTVLHFLRGVFSGFDDAKKRRLLPPLKGGQPGGQVQIDDHAGVCDVIRHFRPDHSDTLAIRLQRGSADFVTTLRQQLKSLDWNVLSKLFFVGGYEAHDLHGLVDIALERHIDLSTKRAATGWISGRIEAVARERADLFQNAPPRGSIHDLQNRREHLHQQLAKARAEQTRRSQDLEQMLDTLALNLKALQREAGWLSQELQAVESDLTEIETRMWAGRTRRVQRVERKERPAVRRTPGWIEEIQAIDREIAHAQQVLRDLAASRMRISIEKAGKLNVSPEDSQSRLERQRQTLNDLEREVRDLRESVQGLSAGNAKCVCSPLTIEVESRAAAIQATIWNICQELSLQQSAQEHSICTSQRDSVDRCEEELTMQIRRLRARREFLVSRAEHPHAALFARGEHEAEHCGCDEHETGVADLTPPYETVLDSPQIIVHEETVHESATRPGDLERHAELTKLRQQLRQQWLAAVDRLRAARRDQDELFQRAREFGADASLKELKAEFDSVEQRLADQREQWDSLALLQCVLKRTQKSLQTEVDSPVIADASEKLRRITDGRYVKFRFDQERKELKIINDCGVELGAHALSRGTLEQAVLCFRLALCAELSRRGLDLPLILDDVLADTDETRVQAAVELLHQHAESQQIFFLTCQEHLVALFESLDVRIRDLPGTQRSKLPLVAETTSTSPRQPSPQHREVSVFEAESTPMDRVQPDDPYWLEPNSPIAYVPSLGEQMARRLGALGVRDVAELIELDPEVADIPLDSLQISAATLRGWQAEARLLCCVPDLTGRDAQLLVACSVFSPSELAEIDLLDLKNRVVRLRQRSTTEHPVPWLNDTLDWPTVEQMQRWIRSGRSARAWKFTRERAHQHRFAAMRPSPRWAGAPSVRPSGIRMEQTVRLHANPVEDGDFDLVGEGEKSLRFFLTLESPVVDAPSIGPRTAERLHAIGIMTVAQLLQQAPVEIARRLDYRHANEQTVREWQQQALLVCQIPELRGHDAQVLVACGFTRPDAVASLTPRELFRIVDPFVQSREGQRLLRSAKTPDLEEVTDWINWARQSPALSENAA